jgi:LysM repeat protein
LPHDAHRSGEVLKFTKNNRLFYKKYLRMLNLRRNLREVSNQPLQFMKYLSLLPVGIALFTASCGGTKTAATNPYENNPYYGPSATGSSTYASTPASATYPTYNDSAYTPPASAAPTVPAASSNSYASNSYSNPSYSSSSPSSYSSNSYSGNSSGGSHTVASGENLYRISVKHGTSVAAIKSANNLSSDTIHPGQKLRIP